MASWAIKRIQPQVLLLISSALVLLSIWNIVGSSIAAPSDTQCTRAMSPWSPAFDAVKYAWRTFEEVEFLIKSVFIEPPSSKVEEAWNSLLPGMGCLSAFSPVDELSNLAEHPLSISLSDLNYIRQDTFTSPSTLGKEATAMSIPEVFLQLKCLNTLRQHTRRDDYDFSELPSFSGPEPAVMQEADMCLDRLRQAFMCWADTTPLLKQIVPNVGTTYDMKTLHYCRNFDSVLAWTRQHGDTSVRLSDIW